jgi:hypothetical protein
MKSDRKLKSLRAALDDCPRNRRGHRRYSVSLREQLGEMSLAWSASGRSLSSLSKALGVSAGMISKFSVGSRRSTIRQVTIAEELSSAMEVRVRLPSGVVIEGLSTAAVIELARALS